MKLRKWRNPKKVGHCNFEIFTYKPGSGKLILEWMITKGNKQERQGPFLTLVIVALSGIIIADKYLLLLLEKGTALFSGIEGLK